MSLIDDLFPGIVLDKAGYPEMEAAIQKKVRSKEMLKVDNLHFYHPYCHIYSLLC